MSKDLSSSLSSRLQRMNNQICLSCSIQKCRTGCQSEMRWPVVDTIKFLFVIQLRRWMTKAFGNSLVLIGGSIHTQVGNVKLINRIYSLATTHQFTCLINECANRTDTYNMYMIVMIHLKGTWWTMHSYKRLILHAGCNTVIIVTFNYYYTALHPPWIFPCAFELVRSDMHSTPNVAHSSR